MPNEFIIKNGYVSKGDSLVENRFSATTISATTYLNLPIDTFSGGTVSGATTFNGGITANTISSTTISGGTFFGNGSGLTNVQNIYNSDGTLTGNRTVSLSGNNLDIQTSGGTSRFFPNGRLAINTTTDGGFQFDVNGSGRISGPLTIDTSTVNNLIFANLGSNGSPYMRWLYNPDETNNEKVLLYQHKVGLLNGSIYIAPTSQVGNNTFAPTGDGNYVFGGGGSLTSGTTNTIVGRSAGNDLTTGQGNTFIGARAGNGVVLGSGNIHIASNGQANVGDLSQTIHIGVGAANSRSLTIGGGNDATNYINNVYIGLGYGSLTNPLGGGDRNVTIQPSTEDGKTDTTALNFRVAGGRATGAGTPGDVIFATSTSGSSGTTLQTLSNRVRIKGNTGFVGIGIDSPTNNLHISSISNPLRLEGLESGNTDTRILTSDSNGVIKYRNLSDFNTGSTVVGDYLPLSGGTVTGNTIFQSGLTATTISATTYLNLPVDPDVYITGFTYSANTFYIYDNSGTTFDATINDVTGLTVNGNMNVTGNTILNNITANTISATTYLNLPFNYYISASTPSGVTLNYGDRWYNTNNGIELVWITDGNSDQWVQPAYNTIPQAYNNVLVTTGLTTSSATLNINVNYYGVNYNGNVDLTLPNPTGYDGYNINIKDEGGNAGTYRIRVTPASGLIDGNNYVDMNINYMSLNVVARNNNWWII